MIRFFFPNAQHFTKRLLFPRFLFVFIAAHSGPLSKNAACLPSFSPALFNTHTGAIQPLAGDIQICDPVWAPAWPCVICFYSGASAG